MNQIELIDIILTTLDEPVYQALLQAFPGSMVSELRERPQKTLFSDIQDGYTGFIAIEFKDYEALILNCQIYFDYFIC